MVGLNDSDFEDVEDDCEDLCSTVVGNNCAKRHVRIGQKRHSPKRAAQKPQRVIKKASFRSKTRGIHLCESQVIHVGQAGSDTGEEARLRLLHSDVAMWQHLEKLEGDVSTQDIGLGLASALDALGRRSEAQAALARARSKTENDTKLALQQVQTQQLPVTT